MANSTFPNSGVQAEKGQFVVLLAYAKDFLDIAIRRKWVIISCILFGLVSGGWGAWFKKDIYRSSTVILVEHQKIPEKYVSSIGGSAAERVSTITQQVLSRSNLQKVIDEFQLSSDTIKRQGYEPVVAGLRKNVKIETKGRRGQLESLTISFAHEDPMVAMRVTSKLASQYIEGNIKIREQFIEGATEFLEQELAVAKEALDEKEKVLSEYKLRFAGELPAQLETNLRTLDRLQLEKIRIQESLNGLVVRLELLKKSIGDYGYPPSLLQGPTKGRMGDPSVIQLSELKKELKKMTGEFTEAYPDVVSLKLQIQRLEEELAQRAEPSHEPDIVTFDPYLAELKNEHNELKLQIDQLTSQLKRTAASMVDFEGRIERTPEREQEILGLERDYGNMQANYQLLHQKRINAGISANLDKRQKGERFRILDPANLPTSPEGIARPLIPLGGLGVGIGLGFALAFLLDLVSPTFRRSTDVEVSLGFPLLASIPSFKMAYGKSMKMLPGVVESPIKMNGKTNGVGQGDYVDTEGMEKGKSLFNRLSSRTSNFPEQFNLVSKWRPQSVVAEQFRVAATRLDLLGDRPMGNVVLVSSAMKGEGKSSTASNLAYTLARDLDEPTLMIDCDYKCPNLHRIFVLRHYPGVADYLAGDVPLEACFQQIPDVPLWCMPVGDMETSPVSLSKLHHLSSLIELVRSRYRFIILDGPPILPLADINVLVGLADIVLMVVRSGVTPKDVVQKATTMLQGTHTTRLVLSDAWSDGVPYYVRQGYAAPYTLTKSE
jgi:succinoglycan biosynthesis transport protein ExoP